MQRFLVLFWLCWIAAAPAFGESSDNLLLHRTYEYFPAPTYSGCADSGDKTQLTDGESRYTGGMSEFPTTVGWSAGIDVPVVMVVDLGQEATLHELRFNTVGGGAAGIVEVGLRVYVSLDNESYVPAGELPAPVPPPEDKYQRLGVQLKVPLNKARGRYVAVVAMAPPPFPFVFVDEILLSGVIPAESSSVVPVQSAIRASGARGLQQSLAGGLRASNLLESLLAPIEQHLPCWPAIHRQSQASDLAEFRQRVGAEAAKYRELRTEITARHRVRARAAYGADALIWEVPPDAALTMLSLPDSLTPPQAASIHTVVNALEATAFGVANLTETAKPLALSFSGGGPESPALTWRVGHVFESTNAKYVADALLANDGPQEIPSGEAKLVWLLAESRGAKPGKYDYTLTFKIGEIVREIPLTVHVHRVTLSQQTPLATGNWSDLNTGDLPLLPQVRDSMLDHRITIGAGTGGAYPFPRKDAQGQVIRPLELDFTPMDQFLEFHKEFPQVSWFLPFDPHSKRPHYDWFGPAEWMSDEFQSVFREWTVALVQHIRSRGRDYQAFHFQIFDETLDDKVAEISELMHQADPQLRVLVTIPQATRASTSRFVKSGVNIFLHHAPQVGHDSPPDGYETLRSEGRELWLYGAADVMFGGGKERDPLGFYRYLHWSAFRHKANGVHFWNMLNNNGRSPVWSAETVEQNYWPLVYCIGPGHPVPPPEIKTSEQVIPSRRWEYVRMGIEDNMLLRMAAERIERLGAAGAADQTQLDEIVRTVMIDRAADRSLFRDKRRELVELVEKLCESDPRN